MASDSHRADGLTSCSSADSHRADRVSPDTTGQASSSHGAPQPASSSGSGNFSVFVNALSGEVRYCGSLEEFYDRIRAAEGQEPPIAVGGWVRRHFVGALTRRSRKAQAAFIRGLREGGRLVVEDYAGEQWCKTLPPRDLAPPPGGRGLSTRADPAASAQGARGGRVHCLDLLKDRE